MKTFLPFFILLCAVCSAQEKQKDVFYTARYGTVKEMKALESADKDTVNAINHMGFSPLILACYRGNTPVAEYLIKKAGNINYNSSSGTALAAVAVKGDNHLAGLLLENGADPNIADPLGMTPLIYAIQFENKELVMMLLKYKADKAQADNNGKSPADYAAFTKNHEIINLLKM